ncbi:MAG: hypothetical protein K2O54_03360, partial [Prevotella sp.]|nr:hypothetical protein [Prevotella sp.]
MKKRFLSFALCIAMLFSLNVTAFAAETEETVTEGSVTFDVDITPVSVPSAGYQNHSIGMLNAFYDTYDTEAYSAIGSFTIRESAVPAGATITKIVVTSTKSSGSTGTLYLYVAKDEDNGDGTFDRYTDYKLWASSLTFPDFGLYGLGAAGDYYVQFQGVRYSTGTMAAATLK